MVVRQVERRHREGARTNGHVPAGLARTRGIRFLEPGGTLLLDNEAPYVNADSWRKWTKDERARLPEPWPEAGMRERALLVGGQLTVRSSDGRGTRVELLLK